MIKSSEIKKRLEEIKKNKYILNNLNENEQLQLAYQLVGDWLFPNNKYLTYEDNTNQIVSNMNAKKHVYIPYKTPLTNGFSNPPSDSAISFDLKEQLKVSFSGTIKGNIVVSLFIIGYDADSKTFEKEIYLNNKADLELGESVQKVRIALRIRGNGVININELSVGNIDLWASLEANQMQIGSSIKVAGNWFFPANPSLVHDENLDLFQYNNENNTKDFVYITHNTTSTVFSKVPDNPSLIWKSEDPNIQIAFKGYKEADVDVKLMVIGYSEEERLDVYQIDLNEQSYFPLNSKVKQFSLAIRVAGKGSFKINQLTIGNKSFWSTIEGKAFTKNNPKRFISTGNARQIKQVPINFHEDTKIIIYEELGIQESKLEEGQVKHLPCFDESDLKNPPVWSLFEPKQNYYYEFKLNGRTSTTLKIDVLIVGFQNSERIEIHQVPLNKKTVVVFDERVNRTKAILRLTGPGFYRDLNLEIEEHEIERTSKVTLDLDQNKWFNNFKKEISFETIEGKIHAGISSGNTRRYISYQEENNSFNKLPSSSIISIKRDHQYEIEVIGKKDDEVNVFPMYIGYSDNKKIEVQQLKFPGKTVIKPNNEVTQIRFSLRLGGIGSFDIDQITISEFPKVDKNSKVKWSNPWELTALGLLPPKSLSDLKMAVIFDKFTMECYRPECQLITFTPENWKERLTENAPDVLMVESAWNGNDGTWNKRVGYYGEEMNTPLKELVHWCKERNIPTIFWNKEDPVHFNRFIETTKLFDYVFTTDANMVPEYQKHNGHSRIQALPFAAQPMVHNPIKLGGERINKACFAGSYYRHHEERVKDMDKLLNAASKYGLDIYDRNYEAVQKGLMPNHTFPEKFQKHILGSLKYYEIDKAYKGYKVMINVNTVKYSPTMFSRRVFEGLACGTPVISSYGEGIEKLFGDLVKVSEDETELEDAFRTLLNDEKVYRDILMAGIREVLQKHTYTNRLKQIADFINLPIETGMPKVTVIGYASTKKEFDLLVQQFERQTYQNKELFMMIEPFEGYLEVFKKYNNRSIKTYLSKYVSKYKNLKEWINTPYISYFSNNNFYGENYLLDLMLCTKYADASIIGKYGFYSLNSEGDSLNLNNPDAEYEYVTSIAAQRCVIDPDIFGRESIDEALEKLKNNEPLDNYLRNGFNLYSSDFDNYIEGLNAKMMDTVDKNMINKVER